MSKKTEPKMKSFRFKRNSIEALDRLTKEVNKKSKRSISATAIVEALIANAEINLNADEIIQMVKDDISRSL